MDGYTAYSDPEAVVDLLHGLGSTPACCFAAGMFVVRLLLRLQGQAAACWRW